ncbi:hypothetical protein [Ulvibacter antarcticus]|uniref:Uncharacterized protein n=1 Tax=Ulvibacter antarcticus TaxID=442714 RepID=A0A3L9Z6R1_9FLAO|nr:hypothetical protein [Ulvibacter antarcticus]RMA67677.1 hypothetical protein BXY75_0030 [Ulvibacter antarcticus]
MRKTKDILIFIFALIVISVFGYGVFLYFYTQKKYAEIPENKIELVSELQSEINLNSNLVEFLDNPIDLLAFKNKKGMEFTTNVTSGTKYYHQPKIKDSIFYVYYYPDFKKESIKIDQFVVFKHGENKHTYEDQTETLIEFRIFNPDSDLEKADLYGLTKTELESEFGTDYLTLDNGIAYSNKNKVLIIELNNSKVKSFRYIKLNTENIDQELIRLIVE